MTIWSLIMGGIRTSFQADYAEFEDRMEIHREHEDILERFRAGDKVRAIAFYTSCIGAVPRQKKKKSASTD